MTHGRKHTSVWEACVVSSISSGGLSDFYLLLLFFRLQIFLARQGLSKVGSFQTQGNIDSQFWAKKPKGAAIKNTRYLLGC